MRVDWALEYQASYPDLVQYLYRRTGDADRAQDLAQEAFMRALDHAPANPRAWLFTCATNLLRTEVRTAMRRQRHLALVRVECEAEPEPDPSEVVERKGRREAVERALSRLSDRDREVLLLWNAGLMYPEIASATGLSLGSIGTTLARARRRMAAVYENGEGRHVARG